jgi:surfeit locus 1 family protein
MMAMYFRPLPIFTALCLPMFLALVALGVWQLDRLQWKLGLIAEMNAHLHAPPASLDAMLRLAPTDVQYRRIALAGRYENAREVYVYTTGENGAAVDHVITPFVLDDGRMLLVDRGEIPLDLKNPATRPDSLLRGEQRVIGVWRRPDAPGLFTPAPDLRGRVWYARDIAGMAKALSLRLAAPVVIEADATPVPGGWPRGGQTVVALPNDHLQYAFTWFLLAAGLVVVYFAYHRSRGRLGFGSQGR